MKTTRERRAELLGDKVVGVDKDYGTSDWGMPINPTFSARSAGHDGGPFVTDVSPEAERILSLWYTHPSSQPRRR